MLQMELLNDVRSTFFFSYTNSTHHVGFLMLLSFIHSIFFFIQKTFPPQNTRDVQLTFFFFTMND